MYAPIIYLPFESIRLAGKIYKENVSAILDSWFDSRMNSHEHFHCMLRMQRLLACSPAKMQSTLESTHFYQLVIARLVDVIVDCYDEDWPGNIHTTSY